MSRRIHEPFTFESIETDQITCKYEAITFFELVFVESGSGVQRMNDHEVPFSSGALFLLLPEEHYSIHLAEKSLVHFIKFHKVFFEHTNIQNYTFNFNSWFQKLEYIFHSKDRFSSSIVKSAEDTEAISNLIKLIVYEIYGKQKFCDIIVQNTLLTILNIIARNLKTAASEERNHSGRPQQLLSYIHYNIYDISKLKMKHLASEFNISKNYFSEYFKSTYGVSMKQYIMEYKLKLAETRMQYTDLSFSEIAGELGFSDLNHLSKSFLTSRKETLTESRKKLKMELATLNQ